MTRLRDVQQRGGNTSRASVVTIARPDVMFEIVKNDALQSVAQEADRRLRLALDQVKGR